MTARRQIKDQVKKHVLSHNNLMTEFANHLGIRVYNLPQALHRNTKATTQIDSIEFLSKLLNKNSDDILTKND